MWLIVPLMGMVLLIGSEAWATPEPEVIAQALFDQIFYGGVRAFMLGIGLGLLIKLMNRS